MRQHLEDDLQRDCVTWFRLRYPQLLIIAIPNGGKRNVREATRLKRMGVTAGVPDLFIPIPLTQESGIRKSGLWVELKIKPNTLTDFQRDMVHTLQINDYVFKICYSLDEFIETVNKYLTGMI